MIELVRWREKKGAKQYIYIYILFLSSANPVLRKAGW
jgi:hypothetical protein